MKKKFESASFYFEMLLLICFAAYVLWFLASSNGLVHMDDWLKNLFTPITFLYLAYITLKYTKNKKQ
ncbi:hypothetical protein R54876_GBNLAHCA_00981 [Eupransor demetentiae]|uniref:Bacteriocin immunity protein n=1 Tax=Eupransor demetentiae TaxID=3109584 RepID=A0ABP0EQ51_9LACO|nr:hypothetical protein R54876_GBNLAHCA_00981 [Lactobacillaceae bacterium LMG 33000]